MDLERYGFLVALSVTTLVLVLAIGIFQRIRVARAKRKEEHSAISTDTRIKPEAERVREGRVQEAQNYGR